MDKSIFQVGDIGVNLITIVDMEQYKFFDFADDYQATLILERGERFIDIESEKRILYSNKRIGIGGLRLLMGHMADFNSDKYSVVHGAGYVVDGKGLLAIGNHGSGKSTIGNILPRMKTIDDDVLLVDNENMCVVGKYGFVTFEEPRSKSKYIEPLKHDDAIKDHKIDVVLLLDKNHEGGYCEQISGIIPREYSVLDALPIELQESYKNLPVIPIDAEVFKIGTNEKLGKTADAIEEILER